MFGAFLVNLVWALVELVRRPGLGTAVSLLVAIALVLLFFYARLFALTVQDRVIRLEMRLLLRERLPEELRPRIDELSVAQLVALRFASDAELPGLVRRVLDEGIADRDAIKRLVREWKPDHLRV